MPTNQPNRITNAVTELKAAMEELGDQGFAAQQVELDDSQRNQLCELAAELGGVAGPATVGKIGDGRFLEILIKYLPMILDIISKFLGPQPTR